MLKLPRIPHRTPVKLTVQLSPELHDALKDYAAVYQEEYGSAEPLADLVPAMLGAFIESDRQFTKARQSKARKA